MIRARSAILRPIPLAAVITLVVNDHFAKRAFHNAVTGKLSDVAGMVFFPVLLWTAAALLGPRRARSHRTLLVASIATAIVFALVKTWAPANLGYAWALGILQWPFRALRAWYHHGAAVPRVQLARTLRDPSDLVALPFAFLGYAAFTRRATHCPAPSLAATVPSRCTSAST